MALETDSGRHFSGACAENAAFNPSLPPLQAALIMLNLAGEPLTAIRRAVLVEKARATLCQHQATPATLATLGCHDVTLANPPDS